MILKTASDRGVDDSAVVLKEVGAVYSWRWFWRVAVTTGNSSNSALSAGTIAWLCAKETGSGKALF
jgi:hypothetical protein